MIKAVSHTEPGAWLSGASCVRTERPIPRSVRTADRGQSFLGRERDSLRKRGKDRRRSRSSSGRPLSPQLSLQPVHVEAEELSPECALGGHHRSSKKRQEKKESLMTAPVTETIGSFRIIEIEIIRVIRMYLVIRSFQ